jgi:N-acetylglutamate synthase-like GNAT family acetyltransferase
LAQKNDAQDLIEFLVYNNGEGNRPLAVKYVDCCFSNDYRKPSFLIHEQDNKIIGAAAFSEELFTVGTSGISWVSVHKNFRNQGIGESLVNACLSNIQGIIDDEAFVILGTYPNKTGLYDKVGFQNIHHDDKHGAFMIKKIKPLK